MIRLDPGRLRPTATTLAVLVGLFRALAFDAVRDFVWADLRAGLLDLRGLPRGTRVLVWLGFGLLFALVGVVLFNDPWRAQFPLLPMVSGVPGRGTHLPVALAPTTLFVLAVAWSFALAGALHSHLSIRLAVLGLYLVVTVPSVRMIAVQRPAAALPAWAALLVVVLFFALRSRRPGRAATDFAVLLACVGCVAVLVQARGIEDWRYSGTPLVLAQLGSNVLALFGLTLPLLLRIGVNLAEAASRASGWLVAIVEDRLPSWALPSLLLLLLGLRLHQVLTEAADLLGPALRPEALPPLVGALFVPLAVGPVWWLTVRCGMASGRERLTAARLATTAEAWALLLILAYFAPQWIGLLLIEVGATLAALPTDRALSPHLQAIALANHLNGVSVTLPWRLLVAGAALAAVVPLARRGRSAAALYLGIFGLLAARSELTSPGRPLSSFAPTGAEDLVDLWWVVLFAVVGLVWWLRGRLTRARAGRLLFLLAVGALLRQTDFLANPFSPVLGFAGIYFIAFGIVWDALTIGAWANATSPRLPRVGRIFLYLGYVLLTVAVINWTLGVHDLVSTSRFTGDQALFGLNLFGRPLVYAVFALTLALPPGDEGAAPRGGPV